MNLEHVKWLGVPGRTVVGWDSQSAPAPYFRREFELATPLRGRIAICGLGFYELYLNGRRVGDARLDPAPSIYDRRSRFVVYDVSQYLRAGRNVVGVILGNGWYNCRTEEAWNFDKASWRDYPKFALRLESDGGEVILESDDQWRVTESGPIRFNELRNGEFYDARREFANWNDFPFDDAGWLPAVSVAPPGGVLTEQLAPPCRVMRSIEAAATVTLPDGRIVADFGINLSGHVRLRVRGRGGAQIELRYGERLHPDGSLDQEHIAKFTFSGEFQCDCYTLRGDRPLEEWAPRFTFHGFQYCQAEIRGEAEILSLTAEFVHSAFEDAGNIACSDEMVTQLQKMVRTSYAANFVGIPSDCPHREKNGWTGDAQLAAEAGLCNFHAALNLENWLETMADSQRPNGQFPGIVPSCGWGYNWGAGPAWDAAFFVIPAAIYLYTGRTEFFRTHFDAMLRYLEYAADRSSGDLADYGLGDWNHVDNSRIAPPELTSSCYIFHCNKLAARFARILGRTADAVMLEARAGRIRKAINARYYIGDGVYAHGEMTALAAPLYFEVAPDAERSRIAAELEKIVRAHRCIPDFGIIGAKTVPRALADAGYVETAFRLLTQVEYPGWGWWVRQGATSLWGNWHGEASRNHIMFGDVSAWFFRYPGGLAPEWEAPGFSRIRLRPRPIRRLEKFRMFHDTPHGRIEVMWQWHGNEVEIKYRAPEDVECILEEFHE